MIYQIVILCACSDTCSNMAQSDITIKRSVCQEHSLKNTASLVIEMLDN